MKTTSLIAFMSLMFVMFGCANKSNDLYAYGDYSESYYASKKEVTSESALRLQKSIEYAIENSQQSRSGRVAPGMYANLGYIYLKSGNANKAIYNFNKEKSVYPESTRFMDRMIKKVELIAGKDK